MVMRFRSEKYVVKVVVSSEGTYNNCLFVEVFNWFLDFSNEIFDFLANNL